MTYQSGKKTDDGYLALPPDESGSGVLVLHAWWGLNDFFVGLCDRLAGAGFVALAPDLYQGRVASSAEDAERLMRSLDAEATQARVLNALDTLRAHPAVSGDAVGVLGCSLGAAWALELSASRPEQIAAAVLFYGVGEADFAVARCVYLGHFAEYDDFDSLETAHEMEAAMQSAGRDITFHAYPGTKHWFFEADRPDAYDADAAQLAWDRTVSFLSSHLGNAMTASAPLPRQSPLAPAS